MITGGGAYCFSTAFSSGMGAIRRKKVAAADTVRLMKKIRGDFLCRSADGVLKSTIDALIEILPFLNRGRPVCLPKVTPNIHQCNIQGEHIGSPLLCFS